MPELNGVTVATYGIAAPVSPHGKGSVAGCAAQPTLNANDTKDELWVPNFVYYSALLGYGANAIYQTNTCCTPTSRRR